MKKYIIILLLMFLIKSLSAQTIRYSYDNLGRLTQAAYPDSSVINYSYDAAGNRISCKTNDKNYKHSQTITFNPLPKQFYGTPDKVLGAIASSGLPVSYLCSNTSIATITNGSLHILSVGAFTITASQPGNQSFLAAANVIDSVRVLPDTVIITATDTSKITGTVNPVFRLSYTGFVNNEDTSVLITKPTVTTTATTSSPVGLYPITPKRATATNYVFKYVSGILTINSVPAPTITSFTPNIAIPGTSITITGTNFTNTTLVSFGGTPASSFKVISPTTIIAVVGNGSSGDVSVTTVSGTGTIAGFIFQFELPSNNFNFTITSATCDGSNNGSINISAAQALSYIATITGNGANQSYPFTDTLTISNLAAGTYNVCLTVTSQAGYQNCDSIVITQPKDLSVYTIVNYTANSVDLSLNGGNQYNINLNGKSYTTSNSFITLPLSIGDNDLIVTTDRACQGMVEKHFVVSGTMIPYPDPFQSALHLNIGSQVLNNIKITVYDSFGKTVFSKVYGNQSGIIVMDLSSLDNGVYELQLTSDNYEKMFKILKQ